MEAAQALATTLGCAAFEMERKNEQTRPVLIDCPLEFKSTLKAYGAIWAYRQKVFVFPSWPQLQAALQEIVSADCRRRLEAEPSLQVAPK